MDRSITREDEMDERTRMIEAAKAKGVSFDHILIPQNRGYQYARFRCSGCHRAMDVSGDDCMAAVADFALAETAALRTQHEREVGELRTALEAAARQLDALRQWMLTHIEVNKHSGNIDHSVKLMAAGVAKRVSEYEALLSGLRTTPTNAETEEEKA